MLNSVRFLPLLLVFTLVLSSLSAQVQDPEAALAREYFNDGEYEKAIPLYEKLYDRDHDLDYLFPLVEAQLEIEQYDAAEKAVQKALRKHKSEPQVKALLGSVYAAQEREADAKAIWNQLLEDELETEGGFAKVGRYFFEERQFDWAMKTYTTARERLGRLTLFAEPMARLHILNGDIDLAIAEYVKAYQVQPDIFDDFKLVVLDLVAEDKNDAIETGLLRASMDNPRDEKLRELLYDFYLKAENYEEALLQARAMDRVLRENGRRVYELAQSLQQNERYELSNEALTYIIKQLGRKSPYYMPAMMERAKNFELEALSTKPLDTLKVRQAIDNYEQLFGEHGRQPGFAEAMIRQARLLLFYAGDVTLAKNQLEKITRLPVHPRFKAEAELLLGDVYLIQQEPLKALKQYQLVDSVLQDETQATQAKYRIARLNYFNGQFKLAKGQLKVLKDNTSNDISNDAIRLYLIIQDNLGMDTTEVPLQLFADAQLAAYQKRYEESIRLMDQIMREYPEHGLRDEILWEKAQIALNQGKTEQAISFLDAIIEKHGTDVWADDAVFTKAELMQFTLNKPKEAQELYLKILMDYSGSLYKVEARKRLRELRSNSL